MVIFTLLASACGGSDTAPARSESAPPSTAAPAEVRDACALITTAEAAKILGSSVKSAAGRSSAERSTCDYVSEGYEAFTLDARWRGAEDEIATARRAAQIAEGAAGASDPVVNQVMGLHKVANLGDEAYFTRRGTSYVRKGDVLLGFENAGLNEPAREHWEALARVALSRLEQR